MMRSLSPSKSIKIIADLSPTYPSGAKTAKKRKFILNTEEDEDLDSQNDIPLFERKKTKLSKMEDKKKDYEKNIIKKIYGRSSSIPNATAKGPEDAKMRASF